MTDDRPAAHAAGAAARFRLRRPGGRRGGRASVLSYWRLYLALSPFYVLFAVFGLYPVVSSILLAFHRWDGLGAIQFVGLEHFSFLLEDPTFWQSLRNTLVLCVMSTVPMLSIALVLAVMLHSAVRFKNFYRIAYFIPNVTSLVAMAIFFSSVFSTNFGLVNAVLQLARAADRGLAEQPVGDQDRDLDADRPGSGSGTTRSSTWPVCRRSRESVTRRPRSTAPGRYGRSSGSRCRSCGRSCCSP